MFLIAFIKFNNCFNNYFKLTVGFLYLKNILFFMDVVLNHRLKVFLGFLIFGVLLGFIENLLVVSLATDHVIDLNVIIISLLVVIPFAIIGELIVDRTSLLPKTTNKKFHALEVFLEFLIFGVLMGTIEDLIVIFILTGGIITIETIIIVILVTIPFAILGEVIIDRKDWFDWIKTKSKRFHHNRI
jgi:hypothetical protein